EVFLEHEPQGRDRAKKTPGSRLRARDDQRRPIARPVAHHNGGPARRLPAHVRQRACFTAGRNRHPHGCGRHRINGRSVLRQLSFVSLQNLKPWPYSASASASRIWTECSLWTVAMPWAERPPPAKM